MATTIQAQLSALAGDPATLKFRRGIEREALRVDQTGNLAQTPHPAALGSKLTHPSITTDFSESQLELITPVSDSIDETLAHLDRTHRFVVSNLGDEVLWTASMPCMLPADKDIPLAQYGTSNTAKLKTTYRNGLGHRYGRAMQTISAVHYNFSFPDVFWQQLAATESQTDSSDYRSRRYFDLMRNFRRFAWLPVYLFGASPAVCKSFVQGKAHSLDAFDEGSLYAPGATSLRSGNLGYQSETQGGMLGICYNGLEYYVSALANAICTSFPGYTALGLKRGDEYVQVNDSILQTEAEFYTNIRAKCVPAKGQNFLKALSASGVEYLEVRLLDINPFLPLGIDEVEIRFLDMLLMHSLLVPSPEHDELLCRAVNDNMQAVVWRGRDATLTLDDGGNARSVAEWGEEILQHLAPIADTMDRVHGGDQYHASLEAQRARLADATLTPSGRIIEAMKTEGIPYFRFAMNQALKHNEAFRQAPLTDAEVAAFHELSAQSLAEQAQIEAADDGDFDAYLARINAEYRDLL